MFNKLAPRPGLMAGRTIKTHAIGDGIAESMAAFASGSGWGDTEAVIDLVARAPVDAFDPAALRLTDSIETDFLSAMRPSSLLDRITGWSFRPLNTSTLIVTTGATAHMLGANRAKPVSAMVLERTTLTPFKVSAEVVVSNELLRAPSRAAEVAIGAELPRALGTATDIALIDPAYGPSTDTPGSITYGATTLNSSGSTITAIDSDLRAVIAVFAAGTDERLQRAVWLMSPNAATYLATLRGTGGAAAYPNVGPRGGELLGVPVFTSGALRASGSPTESAIVLLDPAGILVGEDSSISLTKSESASIQLSDSPTSAATQTISLWSNNLCSLRAERFVSFVRADDGAVVVLDNFQA